MADRSDVEAAVLQACGDTGGQIVADKLLEVMTPGAAMLWLQGYNGHLGGTQPIVVLKLEGSAPVIQALLAFEQGTFI